MKLFLDSRSIDIQLLKDEEINEEFKGILCQEDSPLRNHEKLQEKIIYIKNKSLYNHQNQKIGMILEINNPEDMQNALENPVDDSIELLFIETGDWHIIPIENLIAKYSKQNTLLIASASTPEEIRLLKGILEIGVDGCLLKPNDQYSIEILQDYIQNKSQSVELVDLEVISVEKISSGDRVCVDTCAILKSGEGLLVGSTSAVFVLVEAEVTESGFVNSRPFRINAGVVASYVLQGENTSYLSELAAGSDVMIVDRKGITRNESVARVKIERRPLILLKVKFQEKNYPVILQDAETVRLVNKTGSSPVNEIKPGNIVLGTISGAGRHFGMQVDEFLEEK